MKINKIIYQNSKAILAVGLVLSGFTVYAKENKGINPPPSGTVNKHQPVAIAATCSPATASADLDINNVRARILGGSDMWWDFSAAKYEIPKNTGKTSIFSGALWIPGSAGWRRSP